MNEHLLAGKPATRELLIDIHKLGCDYENQRPDPANPNQLVSFGTSGHRGTPSNGTFNEAHILAITQAICDYRRSAGITGPLFMGKDTHAMSGPAERTALEVLAGNNITVFVQRDNGFTPTPVISHAILRWNMGGNATLADGIIITPSHNPPADGGFRYNPPSGGPADTNATTAIQNHANELLRKDNRDVKRVPYERALKRAETKQIDFAIDYVRELGTVIDMESIRGADVRIGVDPLGGAARHYWEPIREQYQLNLVVVNEQIDPTFSFMPVDHDGRIRMDCSSRWAMQGLLRLQKDFDIAFSNDPDADRHGIVTPSHGLMDPNHYLATAIHFLHTRRDRWPMTAAVGKTAVSSAFIDRVVHSVGRRLAEVPVGFKWFVSGLQNGSYCFGGEESAGASFLKKDGSVWTTDKDGLLLGLLAAEITARTGLNPAEYSDHLTAILGRTFYRRIDFSASPEQKRALKDITPESLDVEELGGDPVLARIVRDAENGASLGGIKVVTSFGWFAGRPSGTENIVKIYAESFRSEEHLNGLIGEAQEMIARLSGHARADQELRVG